MKKNKLFLIVLIGAAVLGGYFLYQHFRPHTLQLSGTLELTEHEVGAPVAGRLASVLVDEGSLVKKGQLLATLDRYEQAKRDYDRVVALFKQGGTTQQAVELAELTLNDESVLSPVDGVVLVKIHESGEVMQPGAAVFSIGDQSQMWVRIFVPEGLVQQVQMNEKAILKLDGMNETLSGHVSFIATKAEFTPRNVQTPEERVTQTFAVKVMLDQPNPNLHAGVSADVTLQTQG